jgi:hypothetical protein
MNVERFSCNEPATVFTRGRALANRPGFVRGDACRLVQPSENENSGFSIAGVRATLQSKATEPSPRRGASVHEAAHQDRERAEDAAGFLAVKP